MIEMIMKYYFICSLLPILAFGSGGGYVNLAPRASIYEYQSGSSAATIAAQKEYEFVTALKKKSVQQDALIASLIKRIEILEKMLGLNSDSTNLKPEWKVVP
jgi:hypothetical protein